MSQKWTVPAVLGLLLIAGCQNSREAEEEAARAAATAEAEAAAVQEAEEAAAARQREAEAQAAAERQAAEAEAAASRAAEEAARRSYEVRKGDCLWYIAADRLANPRRWPEIYEANRSAISDPDLIYPGQVLTIPVGQ